MASLYLDICLSDIPKERIKTAANGKKYLKGIIRPRKDVDRDGYDHYIAAFVPKEEREQGAGPMFIGRAQLKPEYDDQNYQQHKEALANPAEPKTEGTNDLPF